MFGSRVAINVLSSLADCMDRVDPGGPPIRILDLSQAGGGEDKYHLTHQSGRDIDIDVFYLPTAPPAEPYAEVPVESIDARRVWQLIDCLRDSKSVTMILLDYEVQAAVHRAAVDMKGRALDKALQYPHRGGKGKLVRHDEAHRSHLHVRVSCGKNEHDCRR